MMSTISSSSCCSCRSENRKRSSTTSASFVDSRINNDYFDKGTTNPSSLSTTSSFDVVQSQFYDLMRLKNIVINKTRHQIHTQNYIINQQKERIIDTTSTERSSSRNDDDDTEEEEQDNPRENQKDLTEEKNNSKDSSVVGSQSVITVPYDQYETLMRQLEVERIEHAKTKTKCEELADHLDFSRGQIEILQKQLQREKDNFCQILGSVQESNIVGEERKDHLETRVRELHTDNQQLSRRLRSKDTEMEKLQEALAKEKSSQNQRIIDMEVRRCQDDYISSMLTTKATATGRPQLSAKKANHPSLNAYNKTKVSS